MPFSTTFPDDDLTRRLEALEAYGIMDTPPEPEFDDVVVVASVACAAPSALITFVERDRQWFKAKVGFTPCQTPIEESICIHALGSADLLVIPDLATDPRTAFNPAVLAEAGPRFYAGAPLVLHSGVIIGTLCVFDDKPRPEGLTPQQRKALKALARQTVALMEVRRAAMRKDELVERQMNVSAAIRNDALATLAAQEAGKIGTFDLDVISGMMRVSAQFCRIFHVPEQELYPSETFQSRVLTADRGVASSDRSRISGAAPTEVEYRIATPDHGVRWVARSATFLRDARGRPIKMVGTVRDITEAKRSALRTQALLDLGDSLRDLSDIESIALAASSLMAQALDAARAGFGIVDPVTETVLMQPEWCAPGVFSLAGPHRFRDYGSFIEDLKRGETVIVRDVLEDERTRDTAQALLDIGVRVLVNVPVMAGRQFRLVVFVHHSEPFFWTDQELSFVRSFGDRIQNAIQRIEIEAEQKLLNREMSHRLKNSLAMVQAIASQTLRRVTEQHLVEAFEQRVRALSTAHDVLLKDDWTVAPVGAIVASTVHRLGFDDRFDIAGPDVLFGPKGTLSLSLILHELTTNAAKYGALSIDVGRVTITWRVNRDEAQTSFVLDWVERGGPAARAPETTGFGSKLVGMGLSGSGGVTFDYGDLGLSVRFEAALLQLQQAE